MSGKKEMTEAEKLAAREAAKERRVAARKIAERSKSNPVAGPAGVDTNSFEYKAMTAEQQIQLLQDENQASLQRSIQAASQANDLGNDTLVTLGQQREQLNRIRDNLHGINDDMNKSDTTIRNIKSWFGSIFGKKKETPMPTYTPSTMSPSSSASSVTRTHTRVEVEVKDDVVLAAPARRVQMPAHIAARQAQEDAQLGHLSSIMDQLKDKSNAMGRELDEQNELLNEIDQGTEHNIGRIEQSNAELKKILGK